MGRRNLFGALAFAAAIAALSPSANAADAPENPAATARQAAIADDPPFVRKVLRLENVPAATGRRQVLFNGKDLSGWDVWLGARKPELTYTPDAGPPIGLNKDETGVFSVVTEDGAPAILSNGKIYGGLLTKENYGNYHLHIEYKWGKNISTLISRNNGVLYHSHGPQGAFFGSWMASLEFEIVEHHVGMLIGVGASLGAKRIADTYWHVRADTEVGHDPTAPYPMRRYMPGGRPGSIIYPAYNVDAQSDAERPAGEWNSLDLYVLGDRSVHVVNGVPVMVASGLRTQADPAAPWTPLTRGKIQLQSEGSDTYFRNITLEPISALPSVRVIP